MLIAKERMNPWIASMVWLGLLMGTMSVVHSQMKIDKREKPNQFILPLSKSTLTGTEKQLEDLNLSTPNDISLRTFVVGQHLSVQLYQELCSKSQGKAMIHGLCSMYGECGKSSVTIRSCDSHQRGPSQCQNSIPNCDLHHDIMIIRKLFHSNDFQSLTNGANHYENVNDTTHVSVRETDVLTKNHVSEIEADGNSIVLNLESGPATTATILAWKSSFSCSNFSTGNFTIPGSCKEFVTCVEHVPYFRECPSGYTFHLTLMLCDKDENSTRNCSETVKKPSNYDSQKKSTSDTVATRRRVIKREVSSLREMKMNSRRCSESDYYIQPHSEHCNKFEICSNGKIHEQSCGLGALFNPLSLVCDLPHNVDCESRRIDFSTYDCQPGDKYKTSHPDTCKQFIECDKGTLHIKSCPPSTSYNVEDGECVHIYQAKCKKPISLEHDSDVNYNPYQSRPKRSISLNLDCSFNYIAPHPEFCNKFVECENGRIFIKDCGPGTAYNPRLGQCDWPYNVRQPIPGDCSRYRQCHGRAYVEKTCGGTTIFDAEIGKCAFSMGKDYDVDCRAQSLGTPPPS